MGTPSVSVVVATSNRTRLLASLLESISSQRFRDFEVVLVEDSGSPERGREVAEMVRGFSGRLRIRLLVNPRRLGIPRSLNRGVRASRGRIIAFTDDDCVVDELWLEKLTRWYSDPSVGGVGGRVVPTAEREAEWASQPRPYPDLVGRVLWDGTVVSNFDLDRGPLLVDCLPGANMSFRRELVVGAGYFSPVYGGNAYRFETDLALRVRRMGFKIIFDPQAVVYHRRAPVGGARVDVYEWNYWYGRNHTIFLLRCLRWGLVRVAVFAFKQLLRILRRERACPYAEPRRWDRVMGALFRGIVEGLAVGFRYLV